MNQKKDDLAGPVRAKLKALAGETASARRAAGDPVAEVAAGWVGTQYLLSVSTELAGQADGPDRFKLLRQAAGDVVAFQRSGVWSARLELERERLTFQRQKHRDKLAGKLPGATTKRREANAPMTDAELKACVDKVDEIMGLKPRG